MSDEAVLARHEVVLERMRTRWERLKKLKAERRDILGEGDPSVIGARGAFFSNRSPKRGGNKRRSGGQFRGASGAAAAAAARKAAAIAAAQVAAATAASLKASTDSVKVEGIPSNAIIDSANPTAKQENATTPAMVVSQAAETGEVFRSEEDSKGLKRSPSGTFVRVRSDTLTSADGSNQSHIGANDYQEVVMEEE